MMTTVMLLGNPNSGKTTLFNALTGEHQRVGNWSGVTVEKKTGVYVHQHDTTEIIDLPGVYTLTAMETSAQDVQITARAIAYDAADIIVNVIDACHLERHLYLTSQLLERGLPVIIALNMMDLAAQQGIAIDIGALSRTLGCRVIPLHAHRGVGVTALKEAIATQPLFKPPSLSNYLEQRSLEGDTLVSPMSVSPNTDTDMLLADVRYTMVHNWVKSAQKKSSDKRNNTTRAIDKIVLHRILALPIFIFLMYSMFFFAIHIGGALQQEMVGFCDKLFVYIPTFVMKHWSVPLWLITLVSHGIGKGISTALTFIPVMGCMYFFLALLESSGYMTRAAFIIDRIMRALGLPGKSFVPMMIGFGCNVPAIMAARTIDSEQDRLLTILMSPFMSCSARLTIYAVFVAAFFNHHGALIVLSLYILGIVMAILTGSLLRRFLFQGKNAPLILELPSYHTPSFRHLFRETFIRLRYFIRRAMLLIVTVSFVITTLNALPGPVSASASHSYLAWFAYWITPLFSPMGLSQDNWPAVVGLLTGSFAKEVVVGTLNTLYEHLDFASYFDGKIGAYAYLIFVLLYIPCVSTMAAIRQEAGRRLMWLSIIWSLILAYTTAVCFYQLATFFAHPQQSMIWLTISIVSVITLIRCMRHLTNSKVTRYANAVT